MTNVVLPLALMAVATGCGGSGGGGGTVLNPVAASFAESGTPAAADRVRITGSAAGDMVMLDVVLSGTTTSTDLYSFAFDLVLGNAGVVQYMSDSATFGTALTLSGTQQAEAIAAQNGDRITVGVSKVGGGSGNGIGPIEEVIVSLMLQVLARDVTTVTIVGSPPHDPAALDSTGAVVPSVEFDAAAAVISGS